MPACARELLTAGLLVVASACAGLVGDSELTPGGQVAEPESNGAAVSAELQFAEEIAATEVIAAAEGGSITLDVSGKEVTLQIPAGALRTDLVIALAGVIGIGHNESSFIGVDISPPIDVFPRGKEPTLTFGGLSEASFAVAWGADEILESTDLVRTQDGAWQVTLQHFSGAGLGVGDDPVPHSRVDLALDDLYRSRPSAAEVSRTLKTLSSEHSAALRDASSRCHDFTPIREQVRIEQAAQFFGVGEIVDTNRSAIADVLLKSAECARDECAEGDNGAAGRAVQALALMQAFGLDDRGSGVESQVESLDQSLENGDFAPCLTFMIVVVGSADSTLSGWQGRPDFQLMDWFKGFGATIGDGATRWIDSIYQELGAGEVISAGGSDFFQGMAQILVKTDIGANRVKCVIPPRAYPGQVGVSLSFEGSSVELTSGPTLMLEVFLPARIAGKCNNPDVLPDGWEPLGISVSTLAEMKELVIDGGSARFSFSEADEAGPLAWSKTMNARWADPSGIFSGITRLSLIVQVARVSSAKLGDESPRSGLVSPMSQMDLEE